MKGANHEVRVEGKTGLEQRRRRSPVSAGETRGCGCDKRLNYKVTLEVPLGPRHILRDHLSSAGHKPPRRRPEERSKT